MAAATSSLEWSRNGDGGHTDQYAGVPPVGALLGDRETTTGPDSGVPRRRLRLTRASTVKLQRAAWLWHPDVGRIPAGEVSLSAGRGNVGKSPFVLWLSARLSRGDLPGEYHGTPANVLVYASEDSHAHTTVPRLVAADADTHRIHLVEGTETDEDSDMPLNWPLDLPLIEEAIVGTGAKLLVIDPLLDIRKRGANANSTDDWREALRPLIAMAHRTGCAVHGVAHFNKGRTGPVADLLSGAHGLRDAVRAVLVFVGGHEGGERVLGQDKNNLGTSGDDVPRLTFTMESRDVPIEDEHGEIELVSQPVFAITGTTDETLADVIGRTGERGDTPATTVPATVRWMFNLLARAHPHPMLARTLAAQADEQDGPKWESQRKAATKTKLMRSYDDRGAGETKPKWVWALTDAGAALAAEEGHTTAAARTHEGT